MEKETIKTILISMRTPQNEPQVNLLLGKIDMLSQKEINQYLSKHEISKENISIFLEKFLKNFITQSPQRKHPINDMFTYGINGNCIHLHLPGDLRNLLNSIGFSKTFDTINLNLLDAMNRIKALKDNEFYEFYTINQIYLISPILVEKELKFLSEMDFEIKFYKKCELQNNDFIKEHSEALLAKSIFGNDKNVGTASILLNTLSTPEWQTKYKAKVKEFHEKGVFLNQTENEKY